MALVNRQSRYRKSIQPCNLMKTALGPVSQCSAEPRPSAIEPTASLFVKRSLTGSFRVTRTKDCHRFRRRSCPEPAHRGRALLDASPTPCDQSLPESETSAPKGAVGCSYGWSAAEPVDRSLPRFRSSPGGAKELRCRARTPGSTPSIDRGVFVEIPPPLRGGYE
jgi:hypothetical protein